MKITSPAPLDSARRFRLVGGALPLDFCNTVGGRRGAITRECLNNPLDYIAWCHQAGLLDRTQAESCLQAAARRPERAAVMLKRSVELREALFRIFADCIADKAPNRADLARLNSELAQSLGRLRLNTANGGKQFAWAWAFEPGELEQPLGPIAHAAAGLLADPCRLGQVGICNADNCGWLFIDCSKNHSRRWCDMRDCGNRAKIRRHRSKHRAGAGD